MEHLWVNSQYLSFNSAFSLATFLHCSSSSSLIRCSSFNCRRWLSFTFCYRSCMSCRSPLILTHKSLCLYSSDSCSWRRDDCYDTLVFSFFYSQRYQDFIVWQSYCVYLSYRSNSSMFLFFMSIVLRRQSSPREVGSGGGKLLFCILNGSNINQTAKWLYRLGSNFRTGLFGSYLDNKTIRVDILRNPPPKPKCSWCVCKKPRVQYLERDFYDIEQFSGKKVFPFKNNQMKATSIDLFF